MIIVDKNMNPEDYKEIMMKKHNLTEAQWKEVADLARTLLKSDEISIITPFML